MKKVALGIWKDDVEGVEIVVNENLNTIGAILPGGKVIKVPYQDIPTIDDYSCFREGVEKAVWVLNRLNV